MPEISKRRRCQICKTWMEVGEKFEWGHFKFQGIERSFPVHPEHLAPVRITNQLLDEMKVRPITKQEVNTGGNVGLLRLLIAGYSVVSWEVRKSHTKVVIEHKVFGKMFWFI